MTKEVMVTIAGLQAIGEDSEDQDAIELVHIGEYYKKNGNHYILFDEMMEGMAEPVRIYVYLLTGDWRSAKEDR